MCLDTCVLNGVLALATAIFTAYIGHKLVLKREHQRNWIKYRTALLLWGHSHSLKGKTEIIEHFCIDIINHTDKLYKFATDYKIEDICDFIKFLQNNDTNDGFSKWFDSNVKW